MNVRTLDLPPGGFFGAWARDPGGFAEFLPDPFAPDAERDAVERTLSLARPREAVAEALVRQGGEAAGRLADPSAVAIVTGQQPGLLGGPLYGLAKAISTVVAARRFEERAGRPAVPVFWVEGDDHDFEEIRTAWILDSGGKPVSLRYAPDDEAPGTPGSVRRLDDNVLTLLDEFERTLPKTAFSEETVAAARDAYRPGRTLAGAFARLLAWLTRGSGLVVMNPSDPALKALATPVYRAALDRQDEARALVESTSARIEARGFAPQASPTGYGVFRTVDSVRSRAEPPWPDLESAPERASAAVLLRPLVQDALLPTAAYVAGPSELAYHAQMGALYELHGIPRPLVLPRHLVSILHRPALRVLDEDGIGFDELSHADEAALNRRSGDPRSDAALASARAANEERLAAVEAALGALDPSLAGAVARARGKVLGILGDLEGKALRAAKRRDQERRRRFLRARNALFPGGAPQERRLGPLVFAGRYGPGFASTLADGMSDPAAGRLRRNLLVP